MSATGNGHDNREPRIGAGQLDEFFRELRETVLDLERAYQDAQLAVRIQQTDLEARFGSSLANAYRSLAKTQQRARSAPRDPEGRRQSTVHDLLTQMHEELFEINTWFHAEIISPDDSSEGATPDENLNRTHRVPAASRLYRIDEGGEIPVVLRLDQILAGRSWGIGFVFDDQTMTDHIVALMTENALRKFSRDLQDLAALLPRVLRGDPDRFPRLVPPRSGRAFEQLITDILNEPKRHASLSSLCEDYLQKTDIRVNYPDLDRKRGARVQVTTASSEDHHQKKVDGIRHPEEFVILSPWSLASAVPQWGPPAADPSGAEFSPELMERFWKCFPDAPSDLESLSRRLRRMLCDPTRAPIGDPRGPMAEVPQPVRDFIRVWVHHEALRSTKALRQREAIDGRYRRGRDGRLKMRRLPNQMLSASSREFIEQHPTDSVVRAVVKRFNRNAAWVEFAHDLHGRIDRREISWSDATPDPRRYFDVGVEYEFKVRHANISRLPALIELSRKRLIPDPWHPQKLRELAQQDVMEGTVVRQARYGIFVEVGPDLVGLVHESQFSNLPAPLSESTLSVGDKIKVSIDSLSLNERKMSLVPAGGFVTKSSSFFSDSNE